MLKSFLLGSALALLGACANSPALKSAAMSTPGFLNKSDTIELQRPALPVTHFVKWQNDDRLHYGIELDYISGMSARDYLFEEPNRQLFKPMVHGALKQAQLEAPTSARARYALQIEFTELDSAVIGRDFAGKTTATYRIIDRKTNQVAYENTIGSNFVAGYKGLNERDASFAYDVSAPGVIGATKVFGALATYEGGLVEAWNNNEKLRNFFGGSSIDELSQGEWNDAYQSYVWTTGVSALSGPFLVLLGQLNPANYVSLQLADGPEVQRRAAAAPQGNLSESGIGARNARQRAQQLNTHILAQSMTLFLLDLAHAEDVALTHLVACNGAGTGEAELIEAVRSGMTVVSDDCMNYVRKDKNRGVPITSYR